VEQKESIIRAELKRCMSIERRWNRNEVSREIPDKEVNLRPTSLKKFRADEFRGPIIIIIIRQTVRSPRIALGCDYSCPRRSAKVRIAS